MYGEHTDKLIVSGYKEQQIYFKSSAKGSRSNSGQNINTCNEAIHYQRKL